MGLERVYSDKVAHKYLKKFVKKHFGKVHVYKDKSAVFFHKGLYISVNVWEYKGELQIFYRCYKSNYKFVGSENMTLMDYKQMYMTYDITPTINSIESIIRTVKELTNYSGNLHFKSDGESIQFCNFPKTYTILISSIKTFSEEELKETLSTILNIRSMKFSIT